MEDTARQHLLNEIARRDETIARLTAEIALHRQTIDSLCRRMGEEVREQLHFKRAEFWRVRLIRGKFVRIEEPLAKPVASGHPTYQAGACFAIGTTAGVLYTIVENCRRLGIAPRDYLEDVLIRLPGMKASEVAALVPAAWLKARSGKAKHRA